ncbi:MAG: NAD(P)-dependent oxidoreductase [Caldilineaceae bacterium]
MKNEEQLEEMLSRPPAYVLDTVRGFDSDLLILGVGGKMGPTLARMAARALADVNSPHRVIAVARFSQPGLREKLASWGIETIACDLLDRQAVAALPESRHVIFMAGQKFGTAGQQARTWAMNSYMPALAAERFGQARVVVFSTGNVYPLTPVAQGGAVESDAPQPVGEYAMSCLGRERIFEHFSRSQGVRCAIMRLNYAVEMRYGVVLDVAQKVYAGQAVDLNMGFVNVIWQGDANAQAIGLLDHCAAPPFVLNVTGPETLSVRALAERFGVLFGRAPVFVGAEAPTALLSNAAKAQDLFGPPRVSVDQVVEWTAQWVMQSGATLNKPTHFEVRDGNF